MLTIDWAKIDKFYIIFIIVVIFLSIMVIFTFRSVFSAFNTAYEIDQASLDSQLKINKDKLDETYKWVFEKEPINLQLE